MRPMAIDRRQFVAGACATLATSAAAPISTHAGSSTVIASTTRNRDGTFAAVLYDLESGLLNATALPARGHDIAVNPIDGECVAFARRPGTFAVSFGTTNTRPPTIFHTPANRHFYGHGIFSADGRLLYTTENAFETGTGIIGIWDVRARYKRVGEIQSGGIGPHDINLLSDGHTLVIANGGIQTHPDEGRQPLNLPSMVPSLAYVDIRNGDLIEQHQLLKNFRQVSIRHLDVARTGDTSDTVVFGCQFKGARTQNISLIGIHQRGHALHFLPTTPVLHRALRHYVSSVAADRSGEFCAVTSSKGQSLIIIDVNQRRTIATHSFADVSGVAATDQAGRFVLSSGDGSLARADQNVSKPLPTAPKWSWDNHAIAVRDDLPKHGRS